MKQNKQMAAGSHFIWMLLLLTCVFHISNTKHVGLAPKQTVFGNTGNPELDQILSKIPIVLPDGGDFTNVSVTTINVKLCSDLKEELTSLNTKFQQTSLRNQQLDELAFGLRREVRQLEMRLVTCSSTASAIAGSYEAQLQAKLNQLMEVFDSDSFEVLNIMRLTKEVTDLQRKVRLARNSTQSSETDTSDLNKEFSQKTVELMTKKQEIENKHQSSSLFLQVIALQNQIWDLQQEKTNDESLLETDVRILGLQKQLYESIEELQGKNSTTSVLLELISVRSEITMMERLLRVHIEKSRTTTADVQRQSRQKIELLKTKIVQLNRDENNKQLTREILMLQGEVDSFAALSRTTKEKLDLTLREIRVNLEAKRMRMEVLQRQLEEEDYAQAQMMMKFISIMEELRTQQSTTTTTGQSQDILVQLQTYKSYYFKAQAEITDLQKRLSKVDEECSSIEERHSYVTTELERKIAQLNQTDDSKGALILSILNLPGEIQALKQQISNSDDKKLILDLLTKLQRKEEELKSKTTQAQTRFANPQTVLAIITLQNDIWTIQNMNNNGSTDEINAMQMRLDKRIQELDSRGQESTKQMMKVITLQSQVEYLQKLLSNQDLLQTTKISQLTKELTAKESELKQYIDKMDEKNQTNAKLVMSITKLQSKLRKIEKEKEAEDKTNLATVIKLREQLQTKEKENERNQALIKSLQNSLNQTETQCSANEQKIKDLEDNVDSKIKDLASKSETVTSLALQISTQTEHLERLKKQLQNSVTKSKAEALQKMIDEKTAELEKKTKDLEQQSSQPQRFLQIVALQVEIEKLVNVPVNVTDYSQIESLQNELNQLVDGIEDQKNENTRLIFKIMTQQEEIARLKKQKTNQLDRQAQEIKDLEVELENIRSEIKVKTNVLGTSDMRIHNLSAQILDLHDKIQPLEKQLSNLKKSYSEKLSDLQRKLNITSNKLEDSERQLKNFDTEKGTQIEEIVKLKAELKKTQEKAANMAKTEKSVADLEEQLQAQQKEIKKLEITNIGLKQQMSELRTCCAVNTECEDLNEQLELSHDDADRLQRQLREKDTTLKQLQQRFDEQSEEKNKLQENYNDLLKKQGAEEEKTIFSSKITMDPDTANPRIILSEDKTEVTASEFKSKVPKLPGRFDAVLGVIGEKGFSHGRHYWEVNVGGKACYHLGMTDELSQRKGYVTFNPSNGYWTIVLTKGGQLKALDQNRATINTAILPLTLGILLNYEEGQISFYDAQSRTRLYTFTGQTFTNKIYPFIGYCSESTEFPIPITLVSPGPTSWLN